MSMYCDLQIRVRSSLDHRNVLLTSSKHRVTWFEIIFTPGIPLIPRFASTATISKQYVYKYFMYQYHWLSLQANRLGEARDNAQGGIAIQIASFLTIKECLRQKPETALSRKALLRYYAKSIRSWTQIQTSTVW